ncbi:MAG: efflux RND transporter permease subunit [Deltaproteobacteria bacterium]|nr:efflux RND transporter permease subunit [Deltaproteobacteria bacterium]
MSLTRAFVKNRHAVWALALAAAIFGSLAYARMPMQLFPDTAPPLVNVLTLYPGASASDVADDLSRPLEEEFAAVEGIVNVKSSSQDNISTVTVEFQYHRDVNQAALDLQNAIARIRDSLPQGIKEPQVLKFSTNDRPIITLGVAAKDLKEARRLAEDVISPRLQRQAGVAAVDVFGGAVRAVVVDVDLRRAKAYRLPLAKIVDVIRRQNVTLPAGSLRTSTSQTSFRVEARVHDLQQLARLPITLPDGSRHLLSDLATLKEGTLDDDSKFAIDGKRYIALAVYKTEEGNTVDVVDAVIAMTKVLQGEYPGFTFTVGEESGTFTKTSISNLLGNIGQALILASIVIFLFIGKTKLSLVAMVSMPLSYGITFALMKLSGTEFNMVTLSAVILAVGMVVDASVVVLENIDRRRKIDGLDAEEAAIQGTDEVRLPVFAGTATTLAVLVPLLFTGGFTGKTFGPLAMTLLFAFSSSVVVALVLVPVLAVYTGGESRIDDIGSKIASPFSWLMDRLRDFYLLMLRGAMRFRLLTVGLGLLLLVGGVRIIASQGMETLPKMDGGNFYISLETPSGSSITETERVVREVEAIIGKEKEVRKIQSQVGFEAGMKSSASSGARGPTQGFITVTLTDRTSRDESIWDIEARVRLKLQRVPGIRVLTVRELGNTAKATTVAPIVVRISGADPLVLDKLGDEVLARLSTVDSVVEPVRNWRTDKRELKVVIDRLRAGQAGASPASIARQMQMGAVGAPAGEFYGRAGSPIPVWVRYARPEGVGSEQLLDYPILVPGSSSTIPLRAVASLSPSVGRGVVTREDQAATLDVTAFVAGRTMSFVLADVERSLKPIKAPAGYHIMLTGEKKDLGESKKELGGALLISLLAVYLLLVAQLRSFIHPLTIMMSIPLSLIGVALALLVTGKPASMPVMVGMILLVGTVVNNAIILIDFIRQAREGGTEVKEAIVDSVKTRFRPIMMTSLSTIVGMIPLAAEWALGAERFAPLAVAVIGGMSAATLLTLVMIPVLYSLSESLKSGLGRLFRSLRPQSSSALLIVLAGASFAGAALTLPANAHANVHAQGERRLSVDQAFTLATASSEALKSVGEERLSATARRKSARGRLLPQLSAQARYSRLSSVEPGAITMPQLVPGAPAQTMQLGEKITDVFFMRLSLSQPLFSGFGIINHYRASKTGETILRRQETRQRQDLRLQVERSYFALYKARLFESVTARYLSFVEDHLAKVKILGAAGRSTQLAVTKARARRAEVQTTLLKAKIGVHRGALALNMLLGLSADTKVMLASQPSVPKLEAVGTGADLQRKALQERPVLLIAQDRTKQATQRAKSAGAGLWPHLALQAGVNLASPNERYFPPKNEFNGSWDVSLVVSWTAWDWGKTWYQKQAAEADVRRARLGLKGLQRAVSLEVAQLRSGLPNYLQQIAAAEQAVVAAKDALDVASSLFAAGRVASTEASRAPRCWTTDSPSPGPAPPSWKRRSKPTSPRSSSAARRAAGRFARPTAPRSTEPFPCTPYDKNHKSRRERSTSPAKMCSHLPLRCSVHLAQASAGLALGSQRLDALDLGACPMLSGAEGSHVSHAGHALGRTSVLLLLKCRGTPKARRRRGAAGRQKTRMRHQPLCRGPSSDPG